jgi:uncharacterized protein
MSKTAVITGSTSGMGAAFASRLAADGYDLILTGRRQNKIQSFADELTKRHNIQAKIILAELSDDIDIQKVINTIKAADNIEFLINNAGYSTGMQDFEDTNLNECEKMMKVLTVAPLRLVSAVVPQMVKRNKGMIINVSSIGGLFPARGSAAYCASKAFIKFFSEALYIELKDKGIKVQVLCPGFVDTDFFRNLKKEREAASRSGFKKQSPEEVVDISLKYLERNRSICLPGLSYKALNAVFSCLPRPVYYRFMARARH